MLVCDVQEADRNQIVGEVGFGKHLPGKPEDSSKSYANGHCCVLEREPGRAS